MYYETRANIIASGVVQRGEYKIHFPPCNLFMLQLYWLYYWKHHKFINLYSVRKILFYSTGLCWLLKRAIVLNPTASVNAVKFLIFNHLSGELLKERGLNSNVITSGRIYLVLINTSKILLSMPTKLCNIPCTDCIRKTGKHNIASRFLSKMCIHRRKCHNVLFIFNQNLGTTSLRQNQQRFQCQWFHYIIWN